MQLNRRYLFLSTLGLRSIELSPSYSCIAMVCSKCERVNFVYFCLLLHSAEGYFIQKLSKLATPDPFNVTSSKEGKRKIADNTLLSMRGRGVGSSAAGAKGKGRYSPYAAKKCVDCNSNVSQNNAKYCHSASILFGDNAASIELINLRLRIQERPLQYMRQGKHHMRI